mmetsp:Transcript_125054/g.176509  ORF Transcript_125054/g.176509 Transcript_125054/m.176509 type:complete len:148 (-) Transcript_125054:94-537(-)
MGKKKDAEPAPEVQTEVVEDDRSVLMKRLQNAGCLTVCCCSVCTLCYCDWPTCFGCRGNSSCLCCHCQCQWSHFFGLYNAGCRLCINENEECCGSGCCTLIACNYQCCCLIDACAFPCDDNVPCGLALFGLFCMGKEAYKSGKYAKK